MQKDIRKTETHVSLCVRCAKFKILRSQTGRRQYLGVFSTCPKILQPVTLQPQIAHDRGALQVCFCFSYLFLHGFNWTQNRRGRMIQMVVPPVVTKPIVVLD